MSRVKSKNTKPELAVRKYLYSKGFRYRIHNKMLPGTPDLSNMKKKVAIFVNGCLWHQHSNCKKASIPKSNKSFWINKLNNNVSRQKKDLKRLGEMGWKYFIVWECEIKNIDQVYKQIKDYI